MPIILVFFLCCFSFANACESIWNNGPTQLLEGIFATVGLPEITTLEQATAIANKKFIRPKGMERWQEYLTVTDQQRSDLRSILRDSSLTQVILPKHKHYDGVLILGATVTSVTNRYQFLFSLAEQGISFDTVYLLGSVRDLYTGNEGDQDYAKKLADLGVCTTEMQMMVDLWHTMKKPTALKSLRLILVQAPNRADGTRANTEDTLHAMLSLTPDVESKRFLVISNNPYVCYQDAVCKKVLKAKGAIVETVGDKASEDEKIENILDSVARCLTNIA